MVDFLTRLYPDAFSDKNEFLDRLRFYSLQRYIVRRFANFMLPIYFYLSNKKNKVESLSSNLRGAPLIVSLTSFPARIDKVHLVIESLFRQKHLPDKIILWLSKEQFKSIDVLPKKLRDQQKRGLEIRLREGDLLSHKKYYYVVKEFPNSNFIVVDDDIFYPSTLIQNLYDFHRRYPNVVCFNRGYKVKTDKDVICQYKNWELLSCEQGPSFNIMPTGVGGVFYPRNILHEEVLNKEVFMKQCKLADDIWLYAMVLLNGNQLVKTNENQLFLPILNKQKTNLTSVNVVGGKNDVQIRNIRENYLHSKGIDVFYPLVKDN